MSEITARVERPTTDQLQDVARLRWRWAESNGRAPLGDEEEFVLAFESWWRTHEHTHRCLVGVGADGIVVGFGFLALTARVPGPHLLSRCSADVQAVFVVPELRNRGVGGRLVGALVDLARKEGAEHVTVHSSSRAVSAYQRAGFAQDPLMLNQTL